MERIHTFRARCACADPDHGLTVKVDDYGTVELVIEVDGKTLDMALDDATRTHLIHALTNVPHRGKHEA